MKKSRKWAKMARLFSEEEGKDEDRVSKNDIDRIITRKC
jgi:hypothetical protein